MERRRHTTGSPRVAVLDHDRRPLLVSAGLLALATLAALAAALLTAPTANAAPRKAAPKLAATTPAATTPAAAAERYTLEGPQVAIYNLAGTAILEPSTGTETTVEVSLSGRDADDLKIGTGRSEGRANLRVIYPGSRVVYPAMGRGSNSSTRVHEDGRFGENHGNTWLGGRAVRISGSGSGTEAHADLKVRIPAGTDVLLRLAVGDVRVSNVNSKLMIDTGSGAVLASDTRGELNIDTGSGSVRVDHASGPVSIDTGSGSVSVTQLSGGAVSIDTGSGGVIATDLDVSELSIDTGSGHVEVENVDSKSVHIDTGSGGVSVSLAGAIEDLEIDSGSGRVEVELPRDTGAMLTLETGSGGIDADIPLTRLRREHGELQGQMGDGHGRIVIETGSGGIRIAGR